ncbi:MAG: OmpA family protein [Candidatus Muiribacteriaceae bacterium]
MLVFTVFSAEHKELPLPTIEGALIENQESSDLSEYSVVMSVHKEGEFEKIEKVEGSVIRTLFYIKTGKDTDDVLNYYKKQMEEKGFEIQFSGHGSDLGGKFQKAVYALNPWDYDKNYGYSATLISGDINTQHYIVGLKEKAGKKTFAVLNVKSGWYKYPSFRLDIIEDGGNMPNLVESSEEGEETLPVGMIKGSDVVHREIVQLAPYNLVLSPVKDGEFEKVEKIEGRVVRTFYTIEGQSTYAVNKSYIRQLESENYEVLFTGAQNELGSKFQNKIYDANPFDTNRNYGCSIPFTSGSSVSQYYSVFRKVFPEKERYVTLNTITGWDDYTAYRIDIIETEAELPEVITSDAITTAISEKGRMELYGIYFDTGSSAIRLDSKETLETVADFIKSNNEDNFFIVGHTDNHGGFDMNMKLSSERAASVVNYLVTKLGVKKSRLKSHGVGPLCPVFSNDSESGRKFNRRVEIVIE